MSNNSSVKNKVESYIHKAVHVDKEKIKDDSLIFKEGYFDSMGFIMLIAYLEEEFAIKTSDDDLVEDVLMRRHIGIGNRIGRHSEADEEVPVFAGNEAAGGYFINPEGGGHDHPGKNQGD